MSNNNNSGGGCSCLSIILVVILICLTVSFCGRQDKAEGFIDHSIETVHGWWNHVKNVWDGHDPNPDLDFTNQKADVDSVDVNTIVTESAVTSK